MKQPEDSKTLELNLAEAKRGRGRPVKPDALTPAERAKRYRDAKRKADYIAKIKACVEPENNGDVVEYAVGEDGLNEFMRLKQMYWSLEGLVDKADSERDAAISQAEGLRTQLALIVQERSSLVKENEQLKALVKPQDNRDVTENPFRAGTDGANTIASLITRVAKETEQRELAEAERNAAFKENARLLDRAKELQWKLDHANLALVEAENKLATLVNDQAKPPKANPLAAKVRKLEKALAARDTEHSEIMNAMHEEAKKAFIAAAKNKSRS